MLTALFEIQRQNLTAWKSLKEDEMSSRSEDIAVMSADRERTIVRTSVVGIITNLFLVGFKAFVGFLSNSIAVISFDADRKEATETLYGEVAAAYPDYEAIIVPDVDVVN